MTPTMKFTRLQKSPGDDLPYNWDYSDEDVFDTDPIGSHTVTDWQGNPVSGITVGGPAISSPIVQTRISSGANGTVYYLKGRATSTTNGYDREIFLALTVRIPVDEGA